MSSLSPFDGSISRRELLQRSSIGFGQLALASLLAGNRRAGAGQVDGGANPLAAQTPRLTQRAKSVIFCFMQGGPSHVDTFDHKPMLEQNDNKPIPLENVDGNQGRTGNILKPFWRFRKRGQSGIAVSDLFPHIGQCVDDICFINSMQTAGASHFPEQMRLHTGSDRLIRPTLGSWVLYGLGSENENLPGFITICPCYNFGNVTLLRGAFLPSAYQMVPIGRSNAISAPPSFRKATFRNTQNPDLSPDLQRKQLNFVARMNRRQLELSGADAELEGRIASFETAFRMQAAAPPLLDFSGETRETLNLYGVDQSGKTENYARQCLLARRLVERGVRFVELYHAPNSNDSGWDQHNELARYHSSHALEVDKPIAGLLTDLKRRGLLDETLVVWGGEFGRSPGAEVTSKRGGRDHHPWGFTFWMAGGGIKGGIKYGRTDDYGYHAIENPVNFHDLHATILHLLGLDHQQLTFQHGTEQVRLTDALNGLDGNVVHDIIA